LDSILLFSGDSIFSMVKILLWKWRCSCKSSMLSYKFYNLLVYINGNILEFNISW